MNDLHHHYLEEQSKLQSLGTPAKTRQQAIEHFNRLGFPHKKMEDWRFTNHTPFTSRPLRYGGVHSHFRSKEKEYRQFLQEFTHPDEILIVFIDGVFSPELSQDIPRPSVVLRSLKEFLTSPDSLPYQSFWQGTEVFQQEEAFSLLNQAFLEDGVFLFISKGVEVVKPIHLFYLTTEHFQEGMLHPRNLIILEKLAKAHVVETYAHLSQGIEAIKEERGKELQQPTTVYMMNALTDIYLQEGAQLDHYKIQLEAFQAFHMGNISVRVPKDAHYRSFAFQLGGQLSRNNIRVELQGTGASAQVDGLYTLRESQQGETYSFIDHQAPHTQSGQLYKGILDGKSHGVFKGKILVRKAAQQTQSSQLNKNLLFNNLAHVSTQPQLEIYADDVKCNHGATIGQIDQEEVFYLQSRGIPPERAKRILAHAFAMDVILKIPHRELQDRFNHLLSDHFEKYVKEVF